jgi:hypothetical protein
MYLVIVFLLAAAAAIWAAIRWYRSRELETDPIKLRMRQAAKMKWRATATVPEDGHGAAWTQASVRFVRGKEEAVLWYKDATVTLEITPHPRLTILLNWTGGSKEIREMPRSILQLERGCTYERLKGSSHDTDTSRLS